MRFAIVNVETQQVVIEPFEVFLYAVLGAGLQPRELDFGTVAPGLHIAVYEYGLFQPEGAVKFFGLNGALYAGNAVLFSIGDQGETIDFRHDEVLSGIRWMKDRATANLAIFFGQVRRPEMSVDGKVIWTWPQPAPAGMGVSR